MNFLLTGSPVFPPGTTVGAYPRRTFAGGAPVDGEIAGGAPLAATAVVANDAIGSALFEGLEPETTYFAGAQVNGVWHWKTFQTKPETPESEQLASLAVRVTTLEGEIGTGQPPIIQNPGAKAGVDGTNLELLLSIVNATSSSVSPLPAGLTYDPVSRRIHGTPTTPETVTSVIRASGSGGASEESFTWTIAEAALPVITKPADQAVTVGIPVSLQVVATNTTSYAFTGLPAGVKGNTATGLISGTPTGAETPESTVKVTGPSGATAESKWKWTVAAAKAQPYLAAGEPKAESTSTTQAAPAPPEGTQVGDYLLLLVQMETNNAVLAEIPEGLVVLGGGGHGTIGTHSFYALSGPYTGAMPTFKSNVSTTWDVRVLRVPGAARVEVSSSWNDQASSTTLAIASVTTGHANELIVAVTCKVGGTSESTPAGWTAFNTKNQFRVFFKTQEAAGATGATSATLGVAEASTAITLAFEPVPAEESITAALSEDHKSVEPTFLPAGTTSIRVQRAATETGEGAVTEVVAASVKSMAGTVALPCVSLLALNAKSEAQGVKTAFVKTTPEAAIPVVTKPPKQTSNVGKAPSFQVAATESPTGYTLTGAPPGRTINSSGLISGTYSTAGTYKPKVTAKNAAGTSAAVEWEEVIAAAVTGPTTGLVMNSDYESSPSLVAIAMAPGKPLRVEFGVGTAASTIKSVYEKMAARGVVLQPLAGASGRMLTAAEAKGLKAWAEAIAPLGGKYIELQNETNYPNQLPNTKANGEAYATRGKETAEVFVGTGVKVLLQGSDAGAGQHTWLDGIFAVWPGVVSHASFAGWTIHAYPGVKVFGEKDTFGVPMMERMVKALEEKGDTTSQFYVTEWGVPCTSDGRTMTSGQSLNWLEGAKVLEAQLPLLETASKGKGSVVRLAQVLLYQAHDQQPDVSSDLEREHFFGVVQSSGASKGAFTTFANAFL